MEKAAVSDILDVYFLKLAYPLVEDAVIYLVNLSISTNRFAECWRPLMVSPHHKKGGKLEAANYRPVSHIVEMGKIVDRVVTQQILDHLREHKTLPSQLTWRLGRPRSINSNSPLAGANVDCSGRQEMCCHGNGRCTGCI